jgi:hypothetical protein
LDDGDRPIAAAPRGPDTLRGVDTTKPTYFEIAMPGAGSWRDAIDSQIRLEIPVDSSSDQVTGAALLDALSERMRVRFASAEDAREFRLRKGHLPEEAHDGKLVTSIDMLPILVDGMGFLMGPNEDGELFLERPRHTLVTPEAGDAPLR